MTAIETAIRDITDEIVRENEPILREEVNRATQGRKWLDRDAIESAAWQGLWDASVRYSSDRGPFRPWAKLIIRQEIGRELRVQTRRAPTVSIESAQLKLCPDANPPGAFDQIDGLSEREWITMFLLTDGYTVEEVAAAECVTVRTVRRELARIRAKLEIGI